MKLVTFYAAQNLRDEITNLESQIQEIENGKSCSNPISIPYIHNEEFRNEIEKSVINKIRQRINSLEKQFQNLK